MLQSTESVKFISQYVVYAEFSAFVFFSNTWPTTVPTVQYTEVLTATAFILFHLSSLI